MTPPLAPPALPAHAPQVSEPIAGRPEIKEAQYNLRAKNSADLI